MTLTALTAKLLMRMLNDDDYDHVNDQVVEGV
jgi:hypothetical protein